MANKYEWIDDTSDNANVFVNPYNFVSINQNYCERYNAEEKHYNHTGVIECELITKTPLIIPEYIGQEGEHKQYGFMKINGTYVVPGSSIRGPVRSIYETLTNSCFSTVRPDHPAQGSKLRTKDSYFTKRADGYTPFKPGLIEKSGSEYKLYKAERYRVPIDEMKYEMNKIGFGRKVSFDCETVEMPGRDGRSIDYDIVTAMSPDENGRQKYLNQGYLFIGEQFSRKKYESIFVKNDILRIDSLQIQNSVAGLQKTLEDYADKGINRTHNGYKDKYDALFEENSNVTLPIWYSADGNKLYLSPANIGRFAYSTSLNEKLKKLDSCKDRTNVCKACDLFGMVSAYSSGKSLGSKVRFSDALPVGKVIGENVELNELSSPKISFLPFYLKGRGYERGFDASDAELRGRKYYWNFTPDPNVYENKGDRNERNARVELIGNRQEERFRFKVWFDNISEEQLKELVWTLTLGENSEESRRCIKLGHAKPFGFGSVKIIVKEIRERSFNGDSYTETKPSAEDLLSTCTFSSNSFKGNNNVKELIRISTLNLIKSPIQYPSVLGDREKVRNPESTFAPFNWFKEARNADQNYRRGKRPHNDAVLPTLQDDENHLRMKKIRFAEDNSRGGRQNYSNNRNNNAYSGQRNNGYGSCQKNKNDNTYSNGKYHSNYKGKGRSN